MAKKTFFSFLIPLLLLILFFINLQDIEEITDFTESVNFLIKCENLKELEELQAKLNTSASKLNYDDFLVKLEL